MGVDWKELWERGVCYTGRESWRVGLDREGEWERDWERDWKGQRGRGWGGGRLGGTVGG